MWKKIKADDEALVHHVVHYLLSNDPRYAAFTSKAAGDWLTSGAAVNEAFYYKGDDFELGIAFQYKPELQRIQLGEMACTGNISVERAMEMIAEKAKAYALEKGVTTFYGIRPLVENLPNWDLYNQIDQIPWLRIEVLSTTPNFEKLRATFTP